MKKQLLNVKVISMLLVAAAIFIYFLLPKLINTSGDKGKDVPPGPSLAVLPFVNLSNDTNQDFFSDGLSEEILNSLAQIRGLKVCARTSSFKFRGSNLDIKRIGQTLGVQTLLKGSIQVVGDRVRVTAELITVEDGFQVWSSQFDEDIKNVLALQEKIASLIAENLKTTLLVSNRHGLSGSPVVNKKMYESYLKGRACWNRRTPADLLKGIDFFNQAIKADPAFPFAYCGLADCYTALGYGSFVPPAEAFPRAFRAITKALQLDSTLAEAHASLAFYQFYYAWDWAAAEQEFRIALSLNPNYEIGYDWYAYYLTAMERYDEARVILKKAEELDPLSTPIQTDIGFSLYYSGSYDSAIQQLHHVLKVNPKFALANLWLGRSYEAKKMYPQAIQAYKKALAVSVNWPVALAALGHVYGVSGNQVAAQKVLDTLHAISTKTFVTAYGMALVYAGMNNNTMAFNWLNKAIDERSNWLVWIKTDPRWASLQSDNRFAELVNKVALPD